MNQENPASFRALGLGVLLGAGTGFLLGLLLAPEEGSSLRRRISFHLEGLRKQVGDLMERDAEQAVQNEERHHGQALVTDVRTRAQEISDKIDAILGEEPSED